MTDTAILHAIALSAAATALLFAAAHDVAVRTVPNLASSIVAVVGLGLNARDGRLAATLFNGGLVFTASLYCWRRGWIGGGDAKLLSAAAILVPPTAVPELILGTGVAGGVLAVLYLTLARLVPRGTIPRPAGFVRRVWRTESRRIRRGLALPYGCAIAAGALLTLCFPAGSG
jgi:prepilin peptidase CpaA